MRSQEKRAQTEEKAIGEAKARSASVRSTRDQDLMFQKKILGDEGFGSTRLEEFAQAAHRVKEY